jgi:hypothetical protein
MRFAGAELVETNPNRPEAGKSPTGLQLRDLVASIASLERTAPPPNNEEGATVFEEDKPSLAVKFFGSTRFIENLSLLFRPANENYGQVSSD